MIERRDKSGVLMIHVHRFPFHDAGAIDGQRQILRENSATNLGFRVEGLDSQRKLCDKIYLQQGGRDALLSSIKAS